jgi:hypothetical protein
MRVIAVSAIVLALAVAGAAAECVRPASNLYPSSSACPAFAACGAAFCSCVGSSTNMNASTCLANAASTATCASVAACLATQQMCIGAISTYSTNSSSPCFMLGSSIQVAAVAAATSGFANSTLQKSCQYSVCSQMNASSLTCTFGTNDANVCMMPSIAPTPLPTAPTGTLPANFAAAIVAQIRIQGSAFAGLLASNYNGLATAVQSDLARLMLIAAADVVITNMVVGSLVVTFAVAASAGVQPSVLNERLQTATTANWLTSTQSVYSTVSNETLRVTDAPALLSTAAPGAVTSAAPSTAPGATPPTTSPSAAVVSVLASVIAVAAAVVAL